MSHSAHEFILELRFTGKGEDKDDYSAEVPANSTLLVSIEVSTFFQRKFA